MTRKSFTEETPKMNEQHDGSAGAKRLAEVCSELYSLITQLRASENFGAPDELRHRIKSYFENAERAARKHSRSADDFEQAKFALVAFIDETILNSSWPYRNSWAARSLQLEYFGQNIAGELFFQKLAEIRANRERKLELLEVYYLCLGLGYEGKYKLLGAPQLQTLIAEIRGELDHAGLGAPQAISPHGRRSDEIIQSIQDGSLPLWISAAACGAIALLFFLLMNYLIDRSADEAARQITALLSQ